MHASMLWAGPRIRRCPSLPSPLGGQATFPNLTVPLRGLTTWENTEMKAGAFSKLDKKHPREHGYLHIDPITYNNQLLENQSFSAHISRQACCKGSYHLAPSQEPKSSASQAWLPQGPDGDQLIVSHGACKAANCHQPPSHSSLWSLGCRSNRSCSCKACTTYGEQSYYGQVAPAT